MQKAAKGSRYANRMIVVDKQSYYGLLKKKEIPNESFNAVIRRLLGLPPPTCTTVGRPKCKL